MCSLELDKLSCIEWCVEWLSEFVIADVGHSSLDRGLLVELDAKAGRASAPASNHTT